MLAPLDAPYVYTPRSSLVASMESPPEAKTIPDLCYCCYTHSTVSNIKCASVSRSIRSSSASYGFTVSPYAPRAGGAVAPYPSTCRPFPFTSGSSARSIDARSCVSAPGGGMVVSGEGRGTIVSSAAAIAAMVSRPQPQSTGLGLGGETVGVCGETNRMEMSFRGWSLAHEFVLYTCKFR